MSALPSTLAGHLCAVQSADSGSFTAAARVLDLTPAAVGKNVAALEAHLGIRIFNRTTRHIALTEEGGRFIALAREALRTLEDAGASAASRSAPHGMVRISCGVGFGRRFVLPHLPAFFKRYPEVQVELSLSDAKVDLVRDGYDVGIRGGTLPPEGMVARAICDIQQVLVATPRYLARHGMPASWRDLEAHHCLIGLRFLSGQSVPWQFREGRETFSIVPAGPLVLSDPEALVDAALSDFGIAPVSMHHVFDHLKSGALKQVLPRQHQSQLIQMALYYPHRQGMAPRVRVLVDFLLECFGKEPALRQKRGG